MISTLPPEIVLSVLKYFYVQEFLSFRLVSHEWNDFFETNDSAIYHAAAILHNFTDPDVPLEKAQMRYSALQVIPLQSWKDLCRWSFNLENNWEGRGDTPKASLLKSTGDGVHRFQVDDEHRFVISTHRRGGLRVTSIDDDTTLFELSESYVRHFAHCEYGNGFLIFDRRHVHALEIWRHNVTDWEEPRPSSCNGPDQAQFNAVPASPTIPPDPTSRRGTFAPWALFTPPNNPRAYRFVYPTLLVGSQEGQEVYLFDVPTASLMQTIPLPRVGPTGNILAAQEDIALIGTVHILYVELGARHVFVCTLYGVLIISRVAAQQPGIRHVALDFPRMDPALRAPQLIRHYASQIVPALSRNAEMRECRIIHSHRPQQSTALVRLDNDPLEFVAVHVSPSGKDFAAITWQGLAFLVQDFERVFRGEATFSDVALRIDLGCSALNLAFDHNRVVIQTLKNLYVINWDLQHHSVIPPNILNLNNPFPNLTVHKFRHFTHKLSLRFVTCLKLTKTAVWLDWATRALDVTQGLLPEAELEDNEVDELADFLDDRHPYAKRTVCRIDLAPQRSS